MDFDEWIQYGIERGFCSEQYCDTHDGFPYSPTEGELLKNGNNICIHSVRLGDEKWWELDAQNYVELWRKE